MIVLSCILHVFFIGRFDHVEDIQMFIEGKKKVHKIGNTFVGWGYIGLVIATFSQVMLVAYTLKKKNVNVTN